MESGKVYVVHNNWIKKPETNDIPYKIGITKKTVGKRFYGLGLKFPGEFICDFAYEFSEKYSEVEKTLHDMLNTMNVNGEWFVINPKTLNGIRKVCELYGGKEITDLVEKEIKKQPAEKKEMDKNFKAIIDKWNSISEMKAIGRSNRGRNIQIPNINTGVRYSFFFLNKRTVRIQLGCFTKIYPNFDTVLKSFDGLNINGYIFNNLPLRNKDIKNGWKGRIRTEIPIMGIDQIIDTMEKLIEKTKEIIINECK